MPMGLLCPSSNPITHFFKESAHNMSDITTPAGRPVSPFNGRNLDPAFGATATPPADPPSGQAAPAGSEAPAAAATTSPSPTASAQPPNAGGLESAVPDPASAAAAHGPPATPQSGRAAPGDSDRASAAAATATSPPAPAAVAPSPAEAFQAFLTAFQPSQIAAVAASAAASAATAAVQANHDARTMPVRMLPPASPMPPPPRASATRFTDDRMTSSNA